MASLTDLANQDPITKAISQGMNALSTLSQKLSDSATSEAMAKAETNLMRLMDEDGPLALDVELAIRVYDTLATHKENIVDAQRRFIESLMKLEEMRQSRVQPLSNTVPVPPTPPGTEAGSSASFAAALN